MTGHVACLETEGGELKILKDESLTEPRLKWEVSNEIYLKK